MPACHGNVTSPSLKSSLEKGTSEFFGTFLRRKCFQRAVHIFVEKQKKNKKNPTTDCIYDRKSYHGFIFDVSYINHLKVHSKSSCECLSSEQSCVCVHCVVLDLIHWKNTFSHQSYFIFPFIFFGLLCYWVTAQRRFSLENTLQNNPSDDSVITKY